MNVFRTVPAAGTEGEACLLHRNEALLQVQDLCLRTKENDPLLSNISLSLARGQCLGIAGASGSGKTLLCRAILGLVPPGLEATGKVFFEGCSMLASPADKTHAEKRRALRGSGLAFITQHGQTAFDPLATLGTQMSRLVRERCGLTRQAARERIEEALTEVDLPGSVFSAYPHQLSGGMLQRCMIALCCALKARLVVADEPTTALDAVSQSLVLQTLADRVLVLQDGRCVEEGPASRLFQAPEQESTRHMVRTRLLLSRAHARALHDDRPDVPDVPDWPDFSDRRAGTGPGTQANTGSRETGAAATAPASVPAPASGPVSDPAAVQPLLRLSAVGISFPIPGKGLLCRNKRRPILHDITFDLARGSILGLLGPSGSGKTTLARLILGLGKPDCGSIELDGQPVAQWRKSHPGRMSVVFQDYTTSVHPGCTVAGILAEGFCAAGRKAGAADVAACLAEVGLASHLAARLPHQLSGGQLQRVCLARALVTRPDLLVFDEALNALDAGTQVEMALLVRRLCHQAACLFITHDVQLATLVCDRIMVLQDGHVTDLVDTRDLGRSPSPQLASLLQAALEFRSGFEADGAPEISAVSSGRRLPWPSADLSAGLSARPSCGLPGQTPCS